MKMDRIRRNLDLIKVKDLYEFLQAGYDRELRDGTNAPVYPPLSTSLTSSTAIRHVSVGILGDRAREINNVLVGLPSDPGAAVRKSVAGECMDIFKSKDDKAKYDNALAVEAMEGLRQQIELAGREDGFLSIEEQDVLIRQALARHVKTDDARAYLEQFAQQRTPKWRLQAAAKLPSENLPQCGYCSTLAGTANAERCEQCGEPLNIKCPRCSVLMPTSSAACKKCGCRIGDAPIVRDLLRHGQEHRITGHLVAALER
jgi:hypothetical protein